MADAIGHVLHDILAIAAAADVDPTRSSAITCPTCAELHADLVAIRIAIPDAAIPRRPRDYTLSADAAARLRPRPWRQLLAAIATARDGLTRPLAYSFTGLGLAGLLIGAVPGALTGALPFAGSGAATTGPTADPQIEVHQIGPLAAPAASASGGPSASGDPAASAEPGSGPRVAAAPADGTDTGQAYGTLDPSPRTILSLVLLGVGGALFGVRRLAGRSGSVR